MLSSERRAELRLRPSDADGDVEQLYVFTVQLRVLRETLARLIMCKEPRQTKTYSKQRKSTTVRLHRETGSMIRRISEALGKHNITDELIFSSQKTVAYTLAEYRSLTRCEITSHEDGLHSAEADVTAGDGSVFTVTGPRCTSRAWSVFGLLLKLKLDAVTRREEAVRSALRKMEDHWEGPGD